MKRAVGPHDRDKQIMQHTFALIGAFRISDNGHIKVVPQLDLVPLSAIVLEDQTLGSEVDDPICKCLEENVWFRGLDMLYGVG